MVCCAASLVPKLILSLSLSLSLSLFLSLSLSLSFSLSRCGTPINDYIRDLFSSFGYQLSLLTQQNAPGLPVIFSILVTLRHLGGESMVEVLLPHLEPLNSHLQGLVKSSNPSVKDDAMRVSDVLLVSLTSLLYFL